MSYRWKFLLGFQHIFFGAVFVLMIYFTQKHFLQTPELILNIIFNSIFSLGIYYFIYYYLVPKFYLSNKYPEFVLYALVCFLISSLSRILLEPALFANSFLRTDYNSFIYNVYITQGIVILVASFLGITKDKFLIERDVAVLGEEKNQLYVDLLKSKLSPHFLLNTLNNIYVSSFSDSEKTSDAVLQLSKLLQYTIYDSGKEKISLAQEFSSITSLAALYQLRFNDQLNIFFRIGNSEDLDLIEIPPSVLLTLFENSLKHSAVGIDPESFISVDFKIENYVLIFEIENSISKDRNQQAVTGYQGLGNKAILAILDRYFPGNYSFTSEAADSKIYRTSLKINANG
ncbi:histidine kinase [Chryseobacterium sp. Leaf180]|nr:histidine kinase [Chryseobacterium sp. Leaf180]